MGRLPKMHLAIAIGAIAAIVVAACGGSDATATPGPTATKPPAPTATPVPAATATGVPPTATRSAAATPAPTAAATGVAATAIPAATATSVPPTATRPAPPPTPILGVPTPVVKQPTKRGGTLQLRLIPGSTVNAFDPYDTGGVVEFSAFGPMLNNLLQPDPYAKDLVGDIAQGWTVTDGGKLITFTLRKGIKYHDGAVLTSKDVAYNIDRGLNPRDARMTLFKARFSAIQKIETPDDSTVRLTLSAPSNVLLLAMAHPGVLMYPSNYPFPEKKEEWKKAPIGTGPYKVSNLDPLTRIQYVRNPDYFKTGMPYLDALTLTLMTNDVAVAAFRAGRLDATILDSTPTQNQLDELKKAHGWVPVPNTVSVIMLYLNRKAPFTDPKVREAIDLSIDREAIVQAYLQGRGSRLAGPLLPPEAGGVWGITSKELATRLAFQENKTAALARAKQLLQEAGVDSSKITLKLLGSAVLAGHVEVVESSIRALGFKTDVSAPASATDRLIAGDYDIYATTLSLTYDDPKDQLALYVASNGGFNYAKWSNPKIDTLLDQEDTEQDVAKRKDLILQLQEAVLNDHALIPNAARFGYHGYMPWVKNFPTNNSLIYSPLFRWEQVWVER